MSEGETSLAGPAIGITIGAVVVAALLVSGAILAYFILAQDDDDGTKDVTDESLNETVLTILGKDGTETNLTMEELKNISSLSGFSSAQNQYGNWVGHGTYAGAALSALADLAGGMNPGDMLTVTAEDGYRQNFTYLNVFPSDDWADCQGSFVLAYSFNGTEAPSWEEGLKLACIPSDGGYSNEDCNWTSAVGQGFFLNPSAGSRWVKYVVKIEVVDGADDWSVELKGERNRTLWGTEFAMFKEWWGMTVSAKGTNYSGVPASRLMGLVDGGESLGALALNPLYNPAPGEIDPDGKLDAVPFNGYDVILEASDGFSKVVPNGTFVLDADSIFADEADGAPLDADKAPIRAIIPSLKSGYWVSALTDISLVPAWNLELEGEENATVPLSDLKDMDATEGIAYWNPVSFPSVDISGPSSFKGVHLTDLISEVWNMSVDYSVEVVGVDGYSVSLTMGQASGNLTLYDLSKNDLGIGHADAIIAWEEDGEEWFSGGPLRLVFVNGTGAVTDKALSLKWVRTIRVVEYIPDWTLSLALNMTGTAERAETLSRAEFEHGAMPGAHYASVTRSGDLYEGIALWMLVCMVDGNDAYVGGVFDHWEFNDSFAASGYTVRVIGDDGYNATFTSAQVARNDTLIVANMKNGERFDDTDSNWPLRLVSATMPGSKNVKGVLRIEIIP